MKIIIIILLLISAISCSKPKTVFICGDHICVNKDEAQQYFEENLTLEVKIVKKEKPNELSLVELNIKDPNIENKQVYVKQKSKTEKQIKKLTPKEKKNIISKIKEKKNDKKMVSKKILKKDKKISKKTMILDKSKNTKDLKNICLIIKECTIEEISKYLIEDGKKKSFPDITTRQ